MSQLPQSARPSVKGPHADGEKPAFPKTAFRRLLTALRPAQPTAIYLRDGELAVYRRSRSLLYQCRYKLADGTWVRQTTGKASLEHAIVRACDIYDEARYRQRLGLAHRAHSIAHICAVCRAALRGDCRCSAEWRLKMGSGSVNAVVQNAQRVQKQYD
jgi:integrase